MSSNVLESSCVFESTNGLYESSIEQKETINHEFKSVSVIDYLQDNCCFSSTSVFLYNVMTVKYWQSSGVLLRFDLYIYYKVGIRFYNSYFAVFLYSWLLCENLLRSELDELPELDKTGKKLYQWLIGIRIWIICIGRFDMHFEMNQLSRYSSAPRMVHLED